MIIKIKDWSKNKVAWFYALRITIVIILFSTVLHLANVYESVSFRAMFLLFVLLGFILMIRAYSRYHPSTTFVEGFLLCARTGIRFIIVLIPIIGIYLYLNGSMVDLIREKETFGNADTIMEIMLSTAFEMAAAIVISGICASFLTGWDNKVVK